MDWYFRTDTDAKILGQILIFGSYLTHRSSANRSNLDRKALYATYNCAREGDLHDEYYAHRKIVWPPVQLRKKGEAYQEGALRYGYGSPMLSVDVGKQLVVGKTLYIISLDV